MFNFRRLDEYDILVRSLVLPEYMEGGESKWKEFFILLFCLLWPVFLHITYANGWKIRTGDIKKQKPEGGHPPVFVQNGIGAFILLMCYKYTISRRQSQD